MYILLIRSKLPWDAGKEDEHKTQCHTELVTMGIDASYMDRLLSLNKRLILTGQSYCWMLRKMTNTIHIKLMVTMGNDALNKYGTFIFEQKTDHTWYVYVTFWCLLVSKMDNNKEIVSNICVNILL